MSIEVTYYKDAQILRKRSTKSIGFAVGTVTSWLLANPEIRMQVTRVDFVDKVSCQRVAALTPTPTGFNVEMIDQTARSKMVDLTDVIDRDRLAKSLAIGDLVVTNRGQGFHTVQGRVSHINTLDEERPSKIIIRSMMAGGGSFYLLGGFIHGPIYTTMNEKLANELLGF